MICLANERCGWADLILVGGLENEFYVFPYTGNNHHKGLKPPTRIGITR